MLSDMNKYYIESERANLFEVNAVIVLAVQIRGELHFNQLEEAFYQAIEANSILNMRIVLEDDGRAYYQYHGSTENRIYATDLGIEALINQQERIRFRVENGEFLRLFVNLKSTDRAELVFMMHHLGGDGKSLCYFIEDFMKALCGEKSDKKEMFTLNRETLPKDSSMPVLSKLYINRLNREWRKEKRVFTIEDMEQNFHMFWRKKTTATKLTKIDCDELVNQLKVCHEKGIGFSSYFLSKELEKNMSFKKIGIAVDGRSDSNRVMSNQATGISFNYNYDKKKSVLDNAIIINSKMKSLLKHPWSKYFILQFMMGIDSTLANAVNMEYSGYFSSKTSKKLSKLLGYGVNTSDISLTNLTVLDIPTEYNGYKIEGIWFIPPVISYGKNMVGLLTVNNTLFISKHYYVD